MPSLNSNQCNSFRNDITDDNNLPPILICSELENTIANSCWNFFIVSVPWILNTAPNKNVYKYDQRKLGNTSTVEQKQCYRPCRFHPMRLQSYGWVLSPAFCYYGDVILTLNKGQTSILSNQLFGWKLECETCAQRFCLPQILPNLDTSAHCGSCANISPATGRMLGYEWHT